MAESVPIKHIVARFYLTTGGANPVRLTHSAEDNVWPAWSPDGRRIAFGRRAGEPGSIFFVVSADGSGTERQVAEGGSGLSWSPDGNSLALARYARESGGIFLVDVESGKQRDLTSPKPNYDSLPAYSPDGRWIAFTRGEAESRRGIWVISSGGGVAKPVKPGEKRIIGLTWTADSQEIVYST